MLEELGVATHRFWDGVVGWSWGLHEIFSYSIVPRDMRSEQFPTSNPRFQTKTYDSQFSIQIDAPAVDY